MKKLQFGNTEYIVNEETEKNLEKLMFYISEAKMAEKRGIRDDYASASNAVHQLLYTMQDEGVPNQVWNAVIAYTETHDLSECTMERFYQTSHYTEVKDTKPKHVSRDDSYIK